MCINKDNSKDKHKTTICKETHIKSTNMTGIFVTTAGLKTQINNMNLIGNSNIYHIKSPVL